MTSAPVLRVDVSQIPPPYRPKALVGLDFLGTSMGVRVVLSESSAAELRYGGPPDGPVDRPSLWIPFQPEVYDPATVHRCVVIDELPCWAQDRPDLQDLPDLIGATWRLLTLTDESQVAAQDRDEEGMFLTRALPAARRLALDEPFAEWHAELIARRLEACGVQLRDRLSRWPAGRRYAVVITHDADGPRLQQPNELAKALAKAVIRRSRGEGSAFLAGLTTRLLRQPDPYFAFDAWADAERERDLRSAFFLYVRSSVPRHPRDPRYRIDSHRRWEVLRRLADEGWELGVHAAIRAAGQPNGLEEERRLLTAFVDRPVLGVRHHYWRIDWLAPSRTFERHVQAGYEYDASMAWRDRPGYRAGTSLPYFPPTSSGTEVLPLVELPTALMDGHLFEYLQLQGDAAFEATQRLLATTARAGGLFNLDWHERTFCDRYSYRGWATVALRLLDAFDGDAWVTTPMELVRWWKVRATTVGLPDLRSFVEPLAARDFTERATAIEPDRPRSQPIA